MKRRRPLLDDRTPSYGGGLALLGVLFALGLAASVVWVLLS